MYEVHEMHRISFTIRILPTTDVRAEQKIAPD
jgi:hypothetical protein